MPKPKTADLKKKLITDYLSLVQSWNWGSLAKSKRDLDRMGYQVVKDEYTRLLAKREEIIDEQNRKLNEQGRRDEIKRPSGLVFQRHIPPTDSGISFYRDLQKNRRPNQIIKIVIRRNDESTEIMNIDTFLKWIDRYDGAGDGSRDLKEVLDVQLYALNLRGGCDTRSQKNIPIDVNGWKFVVDTVKTTDNNCVFAVCSKVSTIKKHGKTVRKELGFIDGQPISTDDVQKLADYYKLNIVLYYVLDEEIITLDYKCSDPDIKTVCSMLLLKNHYYLVKSLILPEFQQIKTKFDSLIKNIIKTDECHFEIKQEEDFSDFNQIADYIVENKDRHFFIHGQGGTGKSYLQNIIKQKYLEKYGLILDKKGKQHQPILITSSTGISALNIDGQTIHRQMLLYKKYDGFIQDVLIDEISMIDGAVFDDIINSIGDKRLILLGDLKQLPPVQDQYGYFFESTQFQTIYNNLTIINLNKIKRQKDEYFCNILKDVRNGVFTDEFYQLVKKQTVKCGLLDFKTNQIKEIDIPNDWTIVTPTNSQRRIYNDRQLKKLIDSGAEYKDFAQTTVWDNQLLEALFGDEKDKIDQYKAKFSRQQQEKIVRYYVGQYVILNQNMMDLGLANGSRGQIIGFEDDSIIVQFDSGIQTKIQQIKQYKKSVKELFSIKMPLVSSYCLTVHKVQGMTINHDLFVDCYKMWCLELIYVALSRVTDYKLLHLYNPPYEKYIKKQQENGKFLPSETVINFLEQGIFEQYGFRMIVEDQCKQMKISKRKPTKMVKVNQIDFDFETSEYQDQSGVIHHRPYYNHIIYWKNGQKKNNFTLQDYDQKDEETYSKDVAMDSFKFIIAKMQEYQKELTIAKKSKDYKLIKEISQKCIRLVTFNGAGFDLYFILDKILQQQGFTKDYRPVIIFKGNKMVQFSIWSIPNNCFLLHSFDIYQITSPFGLEKSCKAYCPEEAKKLKFKNEIIYLAKNRYRNPEIMEDKDTAIESTEIITIYGKNEFKMDNLKQEDGWTIQEDDLIKLQQLSLDENNHDRRYKIKIQKTLNIRKALDEYAKNDTEVLSVLLESLDNLSFKIFNCSIMNFLTSGTMCWYGFQFNAPKEMFAEKLHDNNRNNKLDKGQQVKTHLYKNEMDEEKFCLKSIIGGKSGQRISRIPKMFDPQTHQRYIYLDISGMYCDIMLRNLFPFGRKIWLNNVEMQSLLKNLVENIPQYKNDQLKDLKNIKQQVIDLHQKFFPNMFIADVEISENPISIEPVIAFKNRVSGTDENPIYKTIYTNEKRRQVLTSIDIITILLKGGQIDNIYKCLQFEQNGMILEKWMKKCLEIKMEGKRLKLDALTAFGKLLANGTYGQTLKQDKHEVVKFVNEEWQVDEFQKEYQLENAFITDSDTDILIGRQLVDKKTFVTSRCSYIGSFVLAYSRLVIQDICQFINPEQDPLLQPLYGDTDSLVVRKDLVFDRLIPAGYIQARSGLLADELADNDGKSFFFPPKQAVYINKFTKQITNKDDTDAEPDEKTLKYILDPQYYKFYEIDIGYFIQPKTLAIKYYDFEEKHHYKIRAKGIPINSTFGDQQESMSFKLFVDLLLKSENSQEEQKGQQVSLPDGIQVITPNLINGQLNDYGTTIKSENGQKIRKNKALYKIVAKEMTRKLFNTEYKGRSVSDLSKYVLVPFGHPNAIKPVESQ